MNVTNHSMGLSNPRRGIENLIFSQPVRDNKLQVDYMAIELTCSIPSWCEKEEQKHLFQKCYVWESNQKMGFSLGPAMSWMWLMPLSLVWWNPALSKKKTRSDRMLNLIPSGITLSSRTDASLISSCSRAFLLSKMSWESGPSLSSHSPAHPYAPSSESLFSVLLLYHVVTLPAC